VGQKKWIKISFSFYILLLAIAIIDKHRTNLLLSLFCFSSYKTYLHHDNIINYSLEIRATLLLYLVNFIKSIKLTRGGKTGQFVLFWFWSVPSVARKRRVRPGWLVHFFFN